MNSFDVVRRVARQARAEALGSTGALQSDSLGLVIQGLGQKGLQVQSVPAADPLLREGQAALWWEHDAVFYDRDVHGADLAALLAHELGHAWLHGDERPLDEAEIVSHTGDSDRDISDEFVGYSPKQRKELQANVFAREFLLPRIVARNLFLAGNEFHTLAASIAVPRWLAAHQMRDGVLLPADSVAATADKQDEPLPDPSQTVAIETQSPTFLLEAGPGTGKTRTLIARVSRLLAEGAAPDSILVLTFSNKAAAEISARLSRSQPQAAPRVWTSTFHALGLELVRRFADRLASTGKLRLVTSPDALSLLEENLHGLPLNHLQNIWMPGMFLKDVLSAISRAKDEMCSPERFLELAKQMLASTPSDDEKALKRAEKIVETAHIYARYEDCLREKGLVDFGDLIKRVTELLESDEQVRGIVQARYKHILIDEYQDVNRASVRLIRALRAAGTTLWVVGDARQSIYRFRGASDVNMRLFESDHGPCERRDLKWNYRSTQPIVDTFVAFSRSMKASQAQLPLSLKAKNSAPGTQPTFTVSDSEEGMLAAMANQAKVLEAAGVPFSQQVVLCGKHAQAEAAASVFERAGIPVLHFGEFFRRPEIRDLLCILDFIGGNNSALLQIAAMPRYGVSGTTVLQVLQTARDENLKGVALLEHAVATLGAHELTRLRSDLAALNPNENPADILTEWAFGPVRYAQPFATGDSASQATVRIAIWQLMRLAGANRVGNARGSRLHQFLNWIRRLISLERDTDFSAVPEEAGTIEGVHIMTTFKAKGLEFMAVHVPYFHEKGLPRTYNAAHRPWVPDGMIEGAEGTEWHQALHEAEEECLYFVALSRARDELRHYGQGGGKLKSSEYLARVQSHLRPVSGPVLAPLSELTVSDDWQPPMSNHVLHADKLQRFDNCPRQYYYDHILQLAGLRADAPYFRAKGVVDLVLREARLTGGPPDLKRMQARLNEEWGSRGPVGSSFEAEYKSYAEQYLAEFCKHNGQVSWQPPEPIELRVPGTPSIQVTPDQMGVDGAGALRLRRVETKRRAENDSKSPLLTLYIEAAKKLANGRRFVVDLFHVGHGAPQVVSISDKVQGNHLKKTQQWSELLRAGDFSPNVGDACRNCRHIFYCPSGLVAPPGITG